MLASKVVAAGRCSLGLRRFSSRRHTWVSYALALPTLPTDQCNTIFHGSTALVSPPVNTQSPRASVLFDSFVPGHPHSGSHSTPERFQESSTILLVLQIISPGIRSVIYIRRSFGISSPSLFEKEVAFCSKGVLFLLSERRLFLREEGIFLFLVSQKVCVNVLNVAELP